MPERGVDQLLLLHAHGKPWRFGAFRRRRRMVNSDNDGDGRRRRSRLSRRRSSGQVGPWLIPIATAMTVGVGVVVAARWAHG